MSCTPLTILVIDTTVVTNAYCRGFVEGAAGQNPEWQTRRVHATRTKQNGQWLADANYLARDPGR